MGRAAKYLAGNAYPKRYKLGATGSATLYGIPYIMVATTGNVGPCTTTAITDGIGMSVGVASPQYSTTQATILANGEGTIEVDINPNLVIEMELSGGATESTALAIYTNTSASSGGTVLTATVPSDDMDGGAIWRYINGVGGEWRTITTHTSTTSLTVTVPFPTAIAVGDTFLATPYNETGNGAAGGDGNSNVTLTTALTQVNNAAASGAGADVVIVDFVPAGLYDSKVRFTIQDHVMGQVTI